MPKLRSQDEVKARVRGNLIEIEVQRQAGQVLYKGDIERAMEDIQEVVQDAASRVALVYRQALPSAIEVSTCETSEGRSTPSLIAARGNYFGGPPIKVRSMWAVRLDYDWRVVTRDHPARVALNALSQQARADMIIRALTNNDKTTVEFGSGVAAPRYRGKQPWSFRGCQLVDLGPVADGA